MSVESVVLPFARLPGEQDFLAVARSESSSDGVALSYPVDEDGIPIRCGVHITNYRTVILPARGQAILIPHMSLDSWEVEKHAMTATQRAAFPQAFPQQLNPTSANVQASAISAANAMAYTLTLNTKYLWNFKVMFQDDRHASTAKKLLDSLRPAEQQHMPAFEMYRERCKDEGAVVASPPQDNGTDVKSASPTSEPFSNYGWNIYSCRHELARQACLNPSIPMGTLDDDCTSAGPGIDLRHWFRATRMAQEDNMYGRSPTYPFDIVAPNSLSDPALVEAIYARSRGRIPAVSFVHLGTGAVLARSSQPVSKGDTKKDADLCYAMVNSGYTLKNSKPRDAARHADPFGSAAPTATGRSVAPPPSLIDSSDAPAEAPPSTAAVRRTRTLMVADCRPYAAAYGNQTMGGGFESGPLYDFCKVKFHGIDNIHGVTKSFNKLKAIVHGFNGKSPRESFFEQLHDSQWLHHIQRVLLCSLEIAEGMERGESFLVHCTDGWDRTSQCTSIAMILLDPFYRTTLGFCMLIEKEFCVFGHKFAERCGHMVRGETYYTTDSGVSSSDTESQQAQQAHKLQPSPVFVQWLDCIFQIMRQFPNKFEFTTQLLVLLAEEVYSCHYGTFLANSEKERTFERIRLGTISLWTHVLDIVAREKSGDLQPSLLNTFYDAQDAWRFISKKECSGIQMMPISCSTKRLAFWEAHYLQFDSDNLSLRLGDTQQNLAVDNRRRREAPYYCEELECYLGAMVDAARQERAKDIPYLVDLLERLQVQRPPPISASNQARNVKITTVDSKSCGNCHEKFGFFASKEYCSRCTTRAPLCSKCIRTSSGNGGGGKKVCPKCADLEEFFNDE